MLYLEIHEGKPEESGLLQAGLDQIKRALETYRLIDLSICEFRIVHNSAELGQSGKSHPFIRICIVPGEDVFAIASLIRARKPHTHIANYGIDVVTMPAFIPGGKRRGCWYDPNDPLRAMRR